MLKLLLLLINKLKGPELPVEIFFFKCLRKKNFEFFTKTPPECPQKYSAQSVQPFGLLYAYECLILLYRL